MIDAVAAKTDSVILMCSLGKDSIVTLDMIYGRFKRIICVHMYFVKGLEHIDRWINWVKAKYPKVEFVEVPHWNLTYVLKYGVYCVAQPKTKILRLNDVLRGLRAKYGIHYVFLGMKKADGMTRRLMLKGYENQTYINKGSVYPLADWTNRQVLSYMKLRSLPPPVRYSLKPSSGVGFDLDCLTWLEKHFPQDLQKIYETFPMCERILWEYNNIQQNGREK